MAGTGSAATSTASNGTSAGVLALVRTHWFSKPLSICTDEARFLCNTPRLAERVIRVMGREIVLYSLFRAFRWFPQRYQGQFDARRVFSHERWNASFHSGSRFQIPPNLWQDLSMHGGSLWLQKLGASVVITGRTTHTCRVGKGKKPDIIDYFLVSTLIRPLIQKCEIVKSVPWVQHQIRNGGVQAADREVQQAGAAHATH